MPNNDTMSDAKPPLGIMPHHIWKERRFLELAQAIARQEEFLRVAGPMSNAYREGMLNMKQWAKEMVDLEIQP